MVRVGIIGCGNYVRNHVKAINQEIPEARIVALCDIVPSQYEAMCKLHFPDAAARPPFYPEHKQMLREAKLDAVIVSTPHTLHFQHCMDALDAGMHVMVEKPMVTNSAQARQAVAKARKAGKVFQIAIQGTYTAAFSYARKLIGDGTMGQLQLVTGVLSQGWLEGTRGKWRQNPALSGGGQLYDSMAHVLSAIMFLVNSPVTEVMCWTDNKGAAVDINAVGCLRFANGCLGSITSGGNCPKFMTNILLQGDGALLEISPHGANFAVRSVKPKDPADKSKGTEAVEIIAVPETWTVPTVKPSRNFIDAILGKADPRCPADLGILLADLMDALYASAASGKPVTVPQG